MEIIFWSAAVFVFYTYFGYPCLISMFARTRPAHESDISCIKEWPSVCVVVAVYNEESRIQKKIANLRRLDYPRNKLRILFVSDGSTDSTATLIAMERDVDLISYEHRIGKPHALNTAVRNIDSEIIVFTDVRQQLEHDVIRYLAANLMLQDVGAVSGELIHVDPATHVARHIGLYWRYEKWIRRSESRFSSTLGVTGALYAIWRKDFPELREDTLLDDFEIPIQIIRHRKRVVFESRARLYDELQTNTASERARKIRTLTGNFQSFVRNPWLFSVVRNPLLFQFLSHKVFRLFVPYALILIFISSFFVDGDFYFIIMSLQVVFYTAAISGMLIPALRNNRVVSFSTVFIELNWAAMLALKNFCSGRIHVRWEKT